MAVVDQNERAVAVGQCANLLQFGDVSVHREHAVGRDELEPRAGGIGLLEPILELVHVRVGEPIALGLREADAVDDRSVVEAVGDDRVGFVEQRLEHAAIGVETGGEDDRVVLAQVAGDRLFELAVERLGAADEPHRGHAEAEFVHRALRRGDDVGMVGEAEVVVGAEIDRFARAFRPADADPPALRPGQQALALEEARRLDLVEGRAEVVEKGFGHGASRFVPGSSIAAPRERSNPHAIVLARLQGEARDNFALDFSASSGAARCLPLCEEKGQECG